MPTSSSTYGTYNPGGIDPFQIESTLAQIVGTNNPAEAGNLLDVYRVQNQTASDQYNYALNQQHEFAKQQLQATIAENALKAAMEGVKTPGGLTVASAMDPSIASRLQGISGPIETNLARAQAADTFNKGAAGLEHSVTAGYPPSTDQASYITGGLTGPQGDPLAVQLERMKLAAQAAKDAQDKNTATVTVWGKIDPDTQKQTQVNMKVPYNNPAETDRRLGIGRQLTEKQMTPGGYGLPGAPVAPPPGSAAPAGGASPPPAQPNAGRQQQPQTPVAPSGGIPDTPPGKYENWTTPQGIKLQGEARQRAALLPPEVREDINKNVLPKTNGNYQIVIRGGRAYFVDSQGNPHPAGK